MRENLDKSNLKYSSEQPMALSTLTFTLKGTRPLLLNNVQSAMPFTEHSKSRKEITKKRSNKTEEDQDVLYRLDWEAKLYLSADGSKSIVIPTRNLKALICAGAKKSGRGLGEKAKEAVFFADAEATIKHNGPKDLDALYEFPGSRDVRMVTVDKKRVPSIRPRFAQWSITATVTVDTEMADLDEVKSYLRRAETIGLGDWHYEFGCFEVSFG